MEPRSRRAQRRREQSGGPPAGKSPAGKSPPAGPPADRSPPGGPHGKGAATRRAILHAAIARFGREGYRSTSVTDIARDASVGGSVAYAYFPNKEGLFFAAVDEDAAGLIGEALASALGTPDSRDWPRAIMFTALAALDRHPLARRILGGLEPEVTSRVLEMPSLTDLRKVCADRLRADQLDGIVRPDIDPFVVANGIVTIMLSLLMSLVQLGEETATAYGDDVAAVFDAAVAPVADLHD
jgi:AcrR family transcriptional regulator